MYHIGSKYLGRVKEPYKLYKGKRRAMDGFLVDVTVKDKSQHG